MNSRLKSTSVGAVAVVLALALPGATVPQDSPTEDVNADTKAKIQQAYGQLALSFEANAGQFDRQVDFLARSHNLSVFLTPTEAVLTLRQANKQERADSRDSASMPAPNQVAKQKQTTKAETTVVRLQLVDSNPHPQVKALQQLPGKSNYLTGKDPDTWHTNIAHYAKVQYQAVYPGIDLVYYGNQQQLEYDFIVAPGANPHDIRLQVAGAKKLEIDKQGNLLLHTKASVIRQHKPVIYQVIKGKKQAVAGSYVLRSETEVGFVVAAYDQKQQLIIDPVLSYSTYLGGSNSDLGYGIAVDRFGQAYVTGETQSTDFPKKNAFDSTLSSYNDAFVTKLNVTGNALVYSTYLGGSGFDYGYGIAVDSSGQAYVTGKTQSTNFPTKNAFDSALGGSYDVFVTKLTATGNALIYSTFLGGSSNDHGYGIAVDSSGNAYVTGETASTNFPTNNAFRSTNSGSNDTFVTKLNTTGNALVYSTYLGGSGFDYARGIAVDSAGNAYVTGETRSTDFPTKNALDGTFNGNYDVFVTKLTATGNALIYSTYLGGSSLDRGRGVAVDNAGQAYVTGSTFSTNFPTKNALDGTRNGSFDVFVTKLNTTGNVLLYSTFLGGNVADNGYGIAVDSSGNAYVTGETASTNFPTKNALDGTFNGSYDVFVTKLTATGNALIYSTYLGGSRSDYVQGIAVDSAGNAYVTGETRSTDFPRKNAIDSILGGSTDAFVTKIAP